MCFDTRLGRNEICSCITPPPLFYTLPTPRRVFSAGVLRSKDFFDPIFVVFRDFCRSYFWHPYFYRVFRYFSKISLIFGDFGVFGYFR